MTGKADSDAGKTMGLGRYLKSARARQDLSLRDVEDATGKEVSNAYLSQLETGKINKPSPHILYALSTALDLPYETLMEHAGYIAPTAERVESAKHGRPASFSIENLTAEEEKALIEHLAFIRWQRKQ